MTMIVEGMAARIVVLEKRVFGLEATIVGLEEKIGGLLAMIERMDTNVEKLPYFSNDELAVILAARRATALPGGEAPPGEASSGDDSDWRMVTGDEPAGRGAGAIRPSWEGPSSGLARTLLPPSPPRLPPTARSATGSNRAKAPPPPPQGEVEEIDEVDSDPYVDPDPAPPPQVGEIMIARQVDGHPEVILRRAPKKARVGEVPNGEEVTVQWVEGEFVCVRWRDIEGVARVENLVRRSPGDIENIKSHCWCADRAHAPRICPACQGFNWAWRKACRHCGGANRR